MEATYRGVELLRAQTAPIVRRKCREMIQRDRESRYVVQFANVHGGAGAEHCDIFVKEQPHLDNTRHVGSSCEHNIRDELTVTAPPLNPLQEIKMKLTPISIAPGQRFRQLDGRDQEQIVTVARLDDDAMGLRRVIFAAPCGREIYAYAAQIEAAIAGGDLAPADDRYQVTILTMQRDEMLAS